ncbi:MAG: hypothetical protein WCQ70_05940 [Lentimicrobiaceae bacterium]
MKSLFYEPENSREYFKVSMTRTAILYILLYIVFHFTQIWPNYNNSLPVIGGIAIIYHYYVYFMKRRKEKKQRQTIMK